MPFKVALKPFSILIYVMVLTGCAFPGVYRVEVQQGNILEKGMAEQLRLGMTKSQVRYILGSPIIADTFNQDRWDYYYSKQKGTKLQDQQGLTIFFINGKVSRIDNELNSDES